ncbi:MAG TPA: hypothetical protein VGE74_08580 [Gemmata sp.]
MSATLAETAAALGFPWDRLADAVQARLDAERAAGHALEGGDPDRAAAAGFELETALLAERRCRGDVADALLLMLQSAIDERFTELWGKVLGFATRAEWRKEVQRFFSTQPGGETWAVQQERRLEEQAEELARAKRDCWDLAVALGRLKVRVEELEGIIAHGHAGNDSGPGRAGGAEPERTEGPGEGDTAGERKAG